MTPVLAMTALGAARAVAAAVLVLLVAVAVRRRLAGTRDPVEATPVAIAAVASLVVAAGLALSVVHGVTAVGWLVILLALDVALLAPAESRERARRALPAATAILAAVIAIGAVTLSRASAERHDRGVRFTQLWIVPGGGDISPFARVGVRNFEGGARGYRIVVTGMRRTFLERTVQIGQSETWSATVQLPLTETPKRVTAQLYRLGTSRAYRTVSVWTRTVP